MYMFLKDKKGLFTHTHSYVMEIVLKRISVNCNKTFIIKLVKKPSQFLFCLKSRNTWINDGHSGSVFYNDNFDLMA